MRTVFDVSVSLIRKKKKTFTRIVHHFFLSLHVCFVVVVVSAGSDTTVDDPYSELTEEDYTPQVDYKTDPNWCHPLRLTNGEVSCHSPRGGAARSSFGTRCEMSCDRGYRLLGRSSIQCLPNRRWSGTAYCRSTCTLQVPIRGQILRQFCVVLLSRNPM